MAEGYSVERAFIDWLRATGVDARFWVPRDRPEGLVTVQRTGGEVENMVDHPQVTMTFWGTSAEEESDLALSVRTYLLGGSRPAGVRKVSQVTGPLWYPDPETRLPCYELVVDCTANI